MGELIVYEIGVKVPNAETWRSLLFHWRAVLNCYLEWEQDDDLPHWHNERAQVGFLAAAAWRMGGVALEEYRTDRADNKTTDVAKKTPGRCDLYISVENLHCVIESKIEWLTTYSPENAGQVEKKIRTAREQLSSLHKEDREECKGMALCWGVATKTACSEDEKESLRRFALGLKGPDRVIAVYYVSSGERAKAERRFEDTEEQYPGVVLIGENHSWTR